MVERPTVKQPSAYVGCEGNDAYNMAVPYQTKNTPTPIYIRVI